MDLNIKNNKKIIGFTLLAILTVVTGKHVYDMNINHNFEIITQGKVYKSGMIPPNEMTEYVKEYHIKSIVDLRMPGTNDLALNPEKPGELMAEKLAVAKIGGVNYFSNPSEQIPT